MYPLDLIVRVYLIDRYTEKFQVTRVSDTAFCGICLKSDPHDNKFMIIPYDKVIEMELLSST